jgi:crotonobetainyl-CoA:carnitine CoA-transferase CaiB-like acyl-CoA transferase
VLVTPPVTIHGMGESQIQPSRRLGYHSQQILNEYGYSAKDIESLRQEGQSFYPPDDLVFKSFAALVFEC